MTNYYITKKQLEEILAHTRYNKRGHEEIRTIIQKITTKQKTK